MACGAVVLILVGLVVLAIVIVKPDDKTFRIYSSLPLQGPQAKQSEDMVNAMKLALKQAKGKAGELEVEYIPRDDSTQAGTFTDATVAKNALEAATDPRAVGYIGEFNSGATAVAIPILSVAKVPQISPCQHGDRTDGQGGVIGSGRAWKPLLPRLSQLRADRPPRHRSERCARAPDER